MGNGFIIGIDEVGRGPWAGPLVAAAVCLPRDIDTNGLTDSKQLTAAKRVSFLRYIQQYAFGIGIGWVSPNYIDYYGLTRGTRYAMYTAWAQLPVRYKECAVLVDGNTEYLKNDVPTSRCIPKGDQTESSIAAASIVAKVLRDRFMCANARKFPEYGFETHVGYGTNVHQSALRKNGACILHRYSFAPVNSVSSK